MDKKSNILNEINTVSHGDKKSIEELIHVFIEQTSEDVLLIYIFLETKDWEALKNLAHKMKSTFICLNQPQVLKHTDFLNYHSGDNIKSTKKHAIELAQFCEKAIDFLKRKTTN